MPDFDAVPFSLADRRMAAAHRAGGAMTILNANVSDEGVEDGDRTWEVNPRDPNELVGRVPVSVSYYTDTPPGYYEDELRVRVRFLEGSAVPETLSVELDSQSDPDNHHAPSRHGLAGWPTGFLADERRRAIDDEQALLRAELASVPGVEATRPRNRL